jgi:hypothetical protein
MKITIILITLLSKNNKIITETKIVKEVPMVKMTNKDKNKAIINLKRNKCTQTLF